MCDRGNQAPVTSRLADEAGLARVEIREERVELSYGV